MATGSVTSVPQSAPPNAALPAGELPLWVRHFRDKSQIRVLLVACLLLVALVVGAGLRHCRELALSEDEAQQAVTGLYFADLLRDLPLSHPVQYTYRYYAQYPALGLIHWPPFFSFAEGVAFLVAGRSVETARVMVLLFLLLGLVFWFKLVSELLNPVAAAFGTLLLPLLPSLYLYCQAVMLFVPALALSIAAAYFWIRCLRTEAPRLLYPVAIFSGLAILTYEHSIFLLTFCVLTLLIERKWSLLLSWTWVRAFALSAVLVVPFYFLVWKFHGRTVTAHVIQHRAYRVSDFTFYWSALAGQLGWPVLLLAGMGVAVLLVWQKRRTALWMLLWILACYLTFTFLPARESRYVMFWLPPFVYFASWPLALAWRRRWAQIAAATACVLVLSTYALTAVHPRLRDFTGLRFAPYPQLAGYSAVARYLTHTDSRGEIILVDDFNDGNGNLIFYMRADDPGRRFVILRKALYVTNIIPVFGSRELLHTRQDLRQLIAMYGIKRIVVSDQGKYHFPIQVVLRELLQEPQFKLMGRFPIVSDQRGASRDLLVYENLQAAPPTAKYLHLKMLTVRRDIVIPLADLGIH